MKKLKLKPISLSKSLEIIKFLKKKSLKCIPVGSIARGENDNSDIDLLVLNNYSNLEKIKKKLKIQIYLKGLRHQGWYLTYKGNKYNIDLFIIKKKELPYMLFHYIGPRSYNIRTRAYVKRKGWLLNQYGLWVVNNINKNNKNNINKNTNKNNTNKNNLKKVKGTKNIKTEKQLTKFLGLTYRLPNNRK